MRKNITGYVDHRRTYLYVSVVKLRRTEFHSNPAPEITLCNFFCPQKL